MPYLRIQTNQAVEPSAHAGIMGRASALLSAELGKPERYVMVALATERPMSFAGSAEPCAYLELKSIGLPADRTGALSAALCRFVGAELRVPAARVYIEFTDAPHAMWGWDSGTF